MFAIITGIIILAAAGILLTGDYVKKQNYKHERDMLKNNDLFKLIQEEGYFPVKNPDGDVSFKIQGTTFLAGECADGFVYTRAYYSLDHEDYLHLLKAANETEMSVIAIKVLIALQRDTMIFSVESFCLDKETYRLFLSRSLSILMDSIERFRDSLNRQEAIQPEQERIESAKLAFPHANIPS